MYAAFFAAKSCELDAVLIMDAVFLAEGVRIYLFPLRRKPVLASPLLAAITEFAPWTYTLLSVIASAPLAAPPVLHLRKPPVQMLLEF
jgi:hypothetical protein